MPLLPVGPDHVGVRPAERQQEAERCRYRCSHGWQCLPLRYLSAHSGRHSRSIDDVGLRDDAIMLTILQSLPNDAPPPPPIAELPSTRPAFLKVSAVVSGTLII